MDIKKFHSKAQKNYRYGNLSKYMARIGRGGGYARAGALTPEARSKIARYAAQIRWKKKGIQGNYLEAVERTANTKEFPDREERKILHARDEEQERQRRILLEQQLRPDLQ